MAEAVAVIGLISSIASLIEISAKIVSRVRDYSEHATELPKTFRSLADRLPILSQTLKRIQSRAQANHIGIDVAKELDVLVKSILEQVTLVNRHLQDVIPSSKASRFDRALIGLKSLAKDEKVAQAVSDHILQELGRLRLRTPPPDPTPPKPVPQQGFGLCLGQAPLIEPDAFIGRQAELEQIHTWLSQSPSSNTMAQRVVSIVGLGGLGKTQLSLAYARKYGHQYSSVFWLNAKSRTVLQQSMSALTTVLFPDDSVIATDADELSVQVEKVRRWLSEALNIQWLIIFDNYDDPFLPNIPSQTGFDIRPFFPTRMQGSVLITTRSPKLTFSKPLKLRKLYDLDMAVAVLSQRSGRDLTEDHDSRQLATRLDGFQLALAMAGTYLAQTAASCTEYLDLYETAWYDLHGPDAEELMEYEGRTLSSTWTISLDQVRRLDPNAAELLHLLGYLNNDDIWYELIKAAAGSGPSWLGQLTATKIRFDRAMSKLGDYSLVEVREGGSYRVHPCLHDWISESLPLSEPLFVAVVDGLQRMTLDRRDPRYWTVSRRLIHHIDRVQSQRFIPLWDSCATNLSVTAAAHWFGDIYRNLYELNSAERMYKRASAGREKALGQDHSSTLDTLNSLGLLYYAQDKVSQAEGVLAQALARKEKTIGPDSVSTLDTLNNLAIIYRHQGKLDQAEQAYERALRGLEAAIGPENASTLETASNLALVYIDQGRLAEAEAALSQTLARQEEVIGPNSISTLDTVNNLGIVYRHQGKLDQAEQTYKRVLLGLEGTVGKEHISSLETLNNLGLVYLAQGNLAEAETALRQVMDGTEKALGRNHNAFLRALGNLSYMYKLQGNLAESESLISEALAGREKALGMNHVLTLEAVDHLAGLYRAQNKFDQVEALFKHFVDAQADNQDAMQKTAIYECAGIWSQAVLVSVNDPVSTQKRMASLIQIVKEWVSSNRMMMLPLARALMGTGDGDNTSIAYCHFMLSYNAAAGSTRIQCDGCGSGIDLETICHSCLRCDDTDLCGECMPKYVAGELSMPTCQGHEYWSISDSVRQSARAGNLVDWATWIARLQEKYPPVV